MITRLLLSNMDRRGQIFLAIIAAAGVLVPLLNLAVPAGSPFHVPTATMALWGKYLCYALLAISLDLANQPRLGFFVAKPVLVGKHGRFVLQNLRKGAIILLRQPAEHQSLCIQDCLLHVSPPQ